MVSVSMNYYLLPRLLSNHKIFIYLNENAHRSPRRKVIRWVREPNVEQTD